MHGTVATRPFSRNSFAKSSSDSITWPYMVLPIKDFMFIVTDNDKVSYAFTFEEKPEGLKEVSVGDKVIVKYTGTISMVDPFMGEVLLVEKQ